MLSHEVVVMVLFNHGLRGSQPPKLEPHPLALRRHGRLGRAKDLVFSGVCIPGRSLTKLVHVLLSFAGHNSQPTTTQPSSPQGKTQHTGPSPAFRSGSLVRVRGSLGPALHRSQVIRGGARAQGIED